MTDQQLDRFASISANHAMTAAAEYIRRNGLTVGDYEVACTVLRQEVKAVLNEALEDAKVAVDAGMVSMAETTFLASMRIAGIAAAKQFAK
jgi:hypothetical protein